MKRTIELENIKAPHGVIMETIRERLIERKFQIRQFSRGEGRVAASRSRMRQLMIGNIRNIEISFRPTDQIGYYELSMVTSHFFIPALYSALTTTFIPVLFLDRDRFYYFFVVGAAAAAGAGLNTGLGFLLYTRFWNQVMDDIRILSMEYEAMENERMRK